MVIFLASLAYMSPHHESKMCLLLILKILYYKYIVKYHGIFLELMPHILLFMIFFFLQVTFIVLYIYSFQYHFIFKFISYAHDIQM